MSTQTSALADQRILVVEDEYYLADDLRRLLEKEGAHVVGPFATVRQAADAVQGADLDCAILDVNLQGEFSMPLCSELEKRSVPMIFVTGYDHGGLPEQFRAAPHFTKPVDTRALLKCIVAISGSGNAQHAG